MPGKLNQAALKNYSDQFTTQVLADFFQTKEAINGQQLLSLTPSKQVNLGIINRLFDKWKADAQAFRSPYFDFENEEVVQAMQEFMNTVSRHISIRKDDLRPLLQESTVDALQLLLAPADYFERRLKSLENFVFDNNSARNLSKYTHIHPAVAKSLALRLTEHGDDYVYVNQALNWLTEIMNGGAALDDITPYVKDFSSVVNLDVSSIAGDTVKLREPVLPQDKKSFFETALSDVSSPAAAPRLTPAEKPVAPIPTSQMLHSLVSSMEPNSLNSQYKADKPLEETTYGNIPLKVDSILKSIALGHRFMFVNQLFNRNSDDFDKAMQELDEADTFEGARSMMEDKFAPRYSWDMKSEVVGDLLALVKRKFN